MKFSNEHAMLLQLLARRDGAPAAAFRSAHSASAPAIDAMVAEGMVAETDGQLTVTAAGREALDAFDGRRWEKWADRRKAKLEAKAPLLAFGGLVERPDPVEARQSSDSEFERRDRQAEEYRAKGEQDRLALVELHGAAPIDRLDTYYRRALPADYVPGRWDALLSGRVTLAEELAKLDELEAIAALGERRRRGEAIDFASLPRAKCNRCRYEVMVFVEPFREIGCPLCKRGRVAYPQLPPPPCEVVDAGPEQAELGL